MADFEQNEMSGSLFLNKRKTRDNHPDRTGTCKINGVEYWVSGWIKKTKANDPWLSLAFTVKEEQQKTSAPKTTGSNQGFDDMDDDIPF